MSTCTARIALVGLLAGGLAAAAPQGAHAQAPRKRKTVGALVVVTQGREWKLAARVLAAVRKSQVAPKTRRVLVETARPAEPREQLRALLLRIRKARKYIFRLRNKRAATILQSVLQDTQSLIRSHGATPGLLRRLMQAHSYLGAALQLDGDVDGAREAFLVALSIRPNRRLSPRYFSAPVIAAYDKIRAAIPKSGVLRINTNRPALVLVDGHLRGIAPTVIHDLIPGPHVVELRRLGTTRITRFVVVDARLGYSLRATLGTAPNAAETRKLLGRVDQELRRSQRAGPAVRALAKRLRVDQLVLCRAGLESAEVSVFDAQTGTFRKRVRRVAPVPGSPPVRRLLKALARPTPRFDLQQEAGGGAESCKTNADCPSGTCAAGRCISGTPFYKTWWFWTVIGVGVAAVAGGTTALVLAPKRPVIRIRISGL